MLELWLLFDVYISMLLFVLWGFFFFFFFGFFSIMYPCNPFFSSITRHYLVRLQLIWDTQYWNWFGIHNTGTGLGYTILELVWVTQYWNWFGLHNTGTGLGYTILELV